MVAGSLFQMRKCARGQLHASWYLSRRQEGRTKLIYIGSVVPDLLSKRVGHLMNRWNVDTLSGLRSDMNVLEDARGLLRLGPEEWQDYNPSKSQPVAGIKPDSILKSEKAQQRTLKAQGRWAKPQLPEKVVAFIDYSLGRPQRLSHFFSFS